MKRKASMSLGVNSIVVLIIAVIVLGLVIGFINQMFTKISRQVQLPECTPETPTGSNPLTLCPETVVASPGEQVAINVMMFNAGSGDLSISGDSIGIKCTDNIVNAIQSLGATIPGGQSKKFGVTFKVSSGAGKGIHLCQIEINSEVKEFKIKIE
ncbi:hypothetical protein J7K74_01195 [Candidatus Woesearchaeota archaeon]|nr:hypothetical protein [Candidatus Woesearchaeota archaeon]